jgi:hypothetical protein
MEQHPWLTWVLMVAGSHGAAKCRLSYFSTYLTAANSRRSFQVCIGCGLPTGNEIYNRFHPNRKIGKACESGLKNIPFVVAMHCYYSHEPWIVGLTSDRLDEPAYLNWLAATADTIGAPWPNVINVFLKFIETQGGSASMFGSRF